MNIFVRKLCKTNISEVDTSKFNINFVEDIDTREMIKILKQSSYILINYNNNEDHNNGISCSGSLQLALSTLCKPIIVDTSNKYLQIENALEFDNESDEQINIDDEIDFKAMEQERNKYVEKFEILMNVNKNIITRYINKLDIPKKIFQTWEHNNIEPEFQDIINKWKEYNPEYEYIFHDAEQGLKFIQENFEKNVVNAYNKIIPGAYKCDLWRYCVLYIYGGFLCRY